MFLIESSTIISDLIIELSTGSWTTCILCRLWSWRSQSDKYDPISTRWWILWLGDQRPGNAQLLQITPWLSCPWTRPRRRSHWLYINSSNWVRMNHTNRHHIVGTGLSAFQSRAFLGYKRACRAMASCGKRTLHQFVPWQLAPRQLVLWVSYRPNLTQPNPTMLSGAMFSKP